MARRLVLTVAVLMVAVVGYVIAAAPPGPRSLRVFDPDRVADLELDMWQAYYAKQKRRLLSGARRREILRPPIRLRTGAAGSRARLHDREGVEPRVFRSACRRAGG